MRYLPLVLALTCVSLFSQTTPTPGTWVNTSAAGYPVSIVGFDKLEWVSSRNWSCSWGEYRTAESENNDALMCYHYPTNRWTLVMQGSSAHSAHRPPNGHDWGNLSYLPELDSIQFFANSGSQSLDPWYQEWQYDFAGMVGSVVPLMTNGGTRTRPWMGGGGELSGYQSWDSNHKLLVFFPALTTADPNAAVVCNPLSTTSPAPLSQAAKTCTTAATTNAPPGQAGSNGTNLRFDPDDGFTYWAYGSGTIVNLSRFNASTPSSGWTSMSSTSCTGADCVGGAPPKRISMGFAYSTTDHVFLMAGGYNGATTFTDTWTFDPAGNSGNGAWTEQCSSCGYSGITQSQAQPGDRMIYDATDNAFQFLTGGKTIWVYCISTCNAFGGTSPSYAPATTSLNRTTPPTSPSSSIAQGTAFDLSMSISGSTLYLAHVEGSPPADGSCQPPVPYVWSSTSSGNWLPTGTLDSACAAMGGLNAVSHPAGHPYVAMAGSTLWEIDDERGIAGSSTDGQVFARTYSGGTGGTWSGSAMTCFGAACFSGSNGAPQQYAQGLIAAGTTPTAAVIETTAGSGNFAPITSLFVAQHTTSWASLSGSTALNIAASSLVSFAGLAADASGNVAVCWSEEVSTRTAMSVTPQLQCKLWNGSSFSRMGTTSLNQSATGWALYPSVANVNGVWYAAWVEDGSLYAKSYNSGANTWSLVGSGALNFTASTGIAFHPTLATDGTMLYLGWEEQSAINQHALGYVKTWNGSSWSAVASGFAADALNGSVSDVSIDVSSGTVTAGWTEDSFGNLPQIYTASYAPAVATPHSVSAGILATGVIQ